MSAAVADAQAWADQLVRVETHGPGDLDRARRRVAARIGVPHAVLWALRYRAPRDVATSIYFALRAAYEAEVERQAKKFAHELEISRRSVSPTVSAPASSLVRAAVAMAGEDHQPRG